MKFSEINKRILHYEEELEYCYDTLNNIINSNKTLQEELFFDKLKIEFYGFVTSCYIDILCCYKNIKKSKTIWEKVYNIKIAYLIAYEVINTYHKYKKEIFDLVKKEEKEKYEIFFDMLNRELYDFKKQFDYNKMMSKIRNKSTAHYDKNFLEYYSIISFVKQKKNFNIIECFLKFINPLHYFSYALLQGEINQFLFVNSWLS